MAKFHILPSLFLLAFVAGCSSPYTQEPVEPGTDGDFRYRGMGKLFGEEGITFGGDKKEEISGITVNSYLWRASLDTFAFMPLASIDPFSGVIITDWYTPPATPKERFKVNVLILDRALRSDGVKVSVFKQNLGKNGQWSDIATDPKLNRDFEDAILTRARQMRAKAN